MTAGKYDIGDKEYLPRLNAVRVLIVLIIAAGYASTMPIGPDQREVFALFGYDPSLFGVQLLFFFSGFLGLRSLERHRSPIKYLTSRFMRNFPMLALLTLITVAVIYPIFGAPVENPIDLFKKLGLYFFETVTCINPGQRLPGLLDDAKYMCLIQGSVWTFKWGVLTHIGAIIGFKLSIFRKKRWLLLFSIISTIILFFAAYYNAVNPEVELVGKLLIPLRLGWPFVLGMAAYAYKIYLPESRNIKIAMLMFFMSCAAISYYFLPWTPAIEIFSALFWMVGALLLIFTRSPILGFLDNWPNIALGIYLVNWPVSQLTLLIFPSLGPWTLIFASMPVTVLIAGLAHALLSKRINIRANIISGRTSFA